MLGCLQRGEGERGTEVTVAVRGGKLRGRGKGEGEEGGKRGIQGEGGKPLCPTTRDTVLVKQNLETDF